MRSRNKQEVLQEARYLVEKGYKEIVLTGIHVGGYGQDLETDSFSNLVSDLLDITGLESLRISSIEESEIDDDLIKLFLFIEQGLADKDFNSCNLNSIYDEF